MHQFTIFSTQTGTLCNPKHGNCKEPGQFELETKCQPSSSILALSTACPMPKAHLGSYQNMFGQNFRTKTLKVLLRAKKKNSLAKKTLWLNPKKYVIVCNSNMFKSNVSFIIWPNHLLPSLPPPGPRAPPGARRISSVAPAAPSGAHLVRLKSVPFLCLLVIFSCFLGFSLVFPWFFSWVSWECPLIFGLLVSFLRSN